MSAIVDYTYYSTVYMGTEADEASFPALCARAEDVIGAMARWQDPEAFTAFQRTLYKKAICAQVEFFAYNLADTVAGSADSRGFTVGKVSVSGRAGGEVKATGAMAGNIAPLAQMYLEQSGLMHPGVPVTEVSVC